MSKIRTLSQLNDAGFNVDGLEPVASSYDIGVSAEMLRQIKAANDPVGLQFIPSLNELNVLDDELDDPIADEAYSPVRGIVHRYPDRVLFKVSNVCAVYCRYCFRRDKIGAGSDHLSSDDFENALDYVSNTKDIWEVILTGGDPLTLSVKKLQRIVEVINRLDHIKILRIHSRIPIANPAVLVDTIYSVLESCEKSVYLVVHVNHADEITDDAIYALTAFRDTGCSILSQSVLLRGVNDNVQVLEDLFRTLAVYHVQPYYLHHLDRARGTSHFRVSLERGKALMAGLQGRVSGACLPKYMLDIPGGYGKVQVNDSSVCLVSEGVYEVTDYKGRTHIYTEGAIHD